MTSRNGTPSRLSFLRCRTADGTYYLNMSWVRGVQRPDVMTLRPGQDGIVGAVVSGQDAVPVYSLAARLQQSSRPPVQTGKIILLKASTHPWALLVDGIEGVVQLTPEAVFPVPGLASNATTDFFDGIIHYGGTLAFSLFPAGLHPATPTRAAWTPHSPPRPEAQGIFGGIASRLSPPGSLVCFSTGATQVSNRPVVFALSISQVPQLLLLASVSMLPVPGAAPYVLGVVSWRYGPLAVIDLSVRLGGRPSPVTPNSRLLVARASTGPAYIGFPVQPGVRTYRLPIAHRPSDRPLPLHRSLMRGQFDVPQGTLVIPDIDGILAASTSAL